MVLTSIYHMTEKELAAEGIPSLPSDLYEVIFNRYVEAKQIEWDRFRIQVHPWELDEYLEKY